MSGAGHGQPACTRTLVPGEHARHRAGQKGAVPALSSPRLLARLACGGHRASRARVLPCLSDSRRGSQAPLHRFQTWHGEKISCDSNAATYVSGEGCVRAGSTWHRSKVSPFPSRTRACRSSGSARHACPTPAPWYDASFAALGVGSVCSLWIRCFSSSATPCTPLLLHHARAWEQDCAARAGEPEPRCAWAPGRLLRHPSLTLLEKETRPVRPAATLASTFSALSA